MLTVVTRLDARDLTACIMTLTCYVMIMVSGLDAIANYTSGHARAHT